MKKSTTLLLTLSIIAASCLIWNAKGIGNPQTNENKSSKVFIIYTSDSLDYSFVVKNTTKGVVHGIPCITGIGVGSYTEGKKVHLLVQHIRSMVEFDSIEEFNKAFEESRKYQP